MSQSFNRAPIARVRPRPSKSGELPVRIHRCLLVAALVAAVVIPVVACGAVSEDFDDATTLPDGWSTTIATGAASDLPWAVIAVGYAGSAPNAAWLDDVNDYADISLVSPTYSVPATGTATVSFHHSYTLWAPDDDALANGVYNGGVLEVSINGAAFEDIVTAGGAFTAGGYDQQLDPGFDNPLAQPPALDRSVWGGASDDFVTTTATLPASAAGGTVALRWRLGTEGGGRSFATHSGWWVDDFSCDACTPSLGDTIFADGFDGTP